MNNSFATQHPELVCEWSERNLPLTPDRITYGSKRIVWWKAACGHEWQTSVKSRSAGEKCPICSGTRVVEGINDLATLEPELALQWSKKNKLKPTQVSPGSHKKVIWKCKHGHEWEASVRSRAVNGTGCLFKNKQKKNRGAMSLFTLMFYIDSTQLRFGNHLIAAIPLDGSDRGSIFFLTYFIQDGIFESYMIDSIYFWGALNSAIAI